FQPIGFTPGEPTGELTRFDRDFTSVSLDAGATYSWENNEGSITSSTTVGAQGFREDETIISANGTTFALPGTFDFDGAAIITAAEANQEIFNGGFYVDEQLGFWNKLYVGAGFRIDAGSSFGDDIDTELYPKATGSYILSEDLDLAFVDEFKLRAAYGETGKFPGAFLKDRTFSAQSFRGESAPRFDNPGNADLRPEKTSTVEAGFDVALLSNRVGLNFTWYNATTSDALFQVPEQPVTGLGTQQRNVGEISNQGVEVALNLQVINTPDLAWSFGGTFQYNDNEVADMGGVADFSVEDSQKRVTEGRPVGSWWVTTPIDTNGDGLPDDSERQFTEGFPVPDKSGSFNTTLSIGNSLSISGLADWAGGHEVFDYGSIWATFNGIFRRELILCGETPDPNCADLFPVQYNPDGTERGRYSQSAARSAFVYDGDWFKLREIAVRYILPESLSANLNVSRATVYATGRNLWIWSRNELVDPELNGLGGNIGLGSESSITLSPNRTFRFGVEVVF
ncbi:MAG: TonB-dependent receptor, partial [Gemmatimonadetes bacterium]|nr:TonB-dependent receptor [Gemmatimonadota bacterium]